MISKEVGEFSTRVYFLQVFVVCRWWVIRDAVGNVARLARLQGVTVTRTVREAAGVPGHQGRGRGRGQESFGGRNEEDGVALAKEIKDEGGKEIASKEDFEGQVKVKRGEEDFAGEEGFKG